MPRCARQRRLLRPPAARTCKAAAVQSDMHRTPCLAKWLQMRHPHLSRHVPHLQQVFQQRGDGIKAALSRRVQLVAVPAAAGREGMAGLERGREAAQAQRALLQGGLQACCELDCSASTRQSAAARRYSQQGLQPGRLAVRLVTARGSGCGGRRRLCGRGGGSGGCDCAARGVGAGRQRFRGARGAAAHAKGRRGERKTSPVFCGARAASRQVFAAVRALGRVWRGERAI